MNTPELSTPPGQNKPEARLLDKWLWLALGFFGWYLASWLVWKNLIESDNGFNHYLLFNMYIFPANIIILIVLAAIRQTRPIGLGILAAMALNLVISLVLGMLTNGICLIPFFSK